MDIVEHFERRQREVEADLAAFEDGRIVRTGVMTTSGWADTTDHDKERLRKVIAVYQRAADIARGPRIAS